MRVEIEVVDVTAGKTASVVAVFKEGDLAVALFEAMGQCRHPADMSTDEALAEIAAHSPETLAACRRMASAAMKYFAGQVKAAGRDAGEPLQ